MNESQDELLDQELREGLQRLTYGWHVSQVAVRQDSELFYLQTMAKAILQLADRLREVSATPGVNR